MKPLISFEEMPGPSNLRAARTLRRRPPADVQLAPLLAEAKKVRIDPAHLKRYALICGYPDDGSVPLPYPQVMAVGLQMQLMTQPEFPLPLLGLVHLANSITQAKPLKPEVQYSVQIGVENGKQSERGYEFEMVTRWRNRDGELWKSIATILFRNRKPPDRKKAPPPEPLGALSDYAMLDAPIDIGRRYGRIAGDMNPIHLYPLTAKLFGFPRHIAHGMWSMARCNALLAPQRGRPASRLDVRFRQPLFLPARTALRSAKAGEAVEFALLGRDSGKTHLTGSLS